MQDISIDRLSRQNRRDRLLRKRCSISHIPSDLVTLLEDNSLNQVHLKVLKSKHPKKIFGNLTPGVFPVLCHQIEERKKVYKIRRALYDKKVSERMNELKRVRGICH